MLTLPNSPLLGLNSLNVGQLLKLGVWSLRFTYDSAFEGISILSPIPSSQAIFYLFQDYLFDFIFFTFLIIFLDTLVTKLLIVIFAHFVVVVTFVTFHMNFVFTFDFFNVWPKFVLEFSNCLLWIFKLDILDHIQYWIFKLFISGSLSGSHWVLRPYVSFSTCLALPKNRVAIYVYIYIYAYMYIY